MLDIVPKHLRAIYWSIAIRTGYAPNSILGIATGSSFVSMTCASAISKIVEGKAVILYSTAEMNQLLYLPDGVSAFVYGLDSCIDNIDITIYREDWSTDKIDFIYSYDFTDLLKWLDNNQTIIDMYHNVCDDPFIIGQGIFTYYLEQMKVS